MEKSLDAKLEALKKNPGSNVFILADAKDADMAFGIASPGTDRDGRFRSIDEFRDQMREIVSQGLIDLILMSASTSEILTLRENIFGYSTVTPAVRANDTTDVHVMRNGRYVDSPSKPFASTTIDHIQAGKCPCTEEERKLGANLGLYSVTFNNDPDRDLDTMEQYKAFRCEAEAKRFTHFLEVFGPNVPATTHGIPPDKIPFFINDHIVRLLAGVPSGARPRFLKIPYYGPKALEELCDYDSSMVVGVLGGSAGTTLDAFALLRDAKRYGARVALFGRKIKAAEHQLSFVKYLRLVADDQIAPVEAVKAYHGTISALGISPERSLEQDLHITNTALSYDSARR
jgi:hypothetical protein